MAVIAIGDALGAGFDLIRRRPLAVLAWGAVQTAFTAGYMAAIAPFYLIIFGQFAAGAARGETPSTQTLAQMMQFEGLSFLLSFASLFVSIVLSCAVFRAVLHPEQRSFGYLRIGAAELFLLLLVIGAYVVFFIAVLVLAIPIAIVAAIGIASHAAGVGILLAVVVSIGAVVAIGYVALRVSLVGPMTVDQGGFRLFDAWKLAKGHVGSLFLIGLCLAVLAIVLAIVLEVVLVAVGVGVLGAAAGGLGNLPTFFKQPLNAILPTLAPMLAVMALVFIPYAGCLMAIWAAPWARAYRDLTGPDLAATFS